MKHLLLVSHATLAQGIEDALRMLLGSHEYVHALSMAEGTSPDELTDDLARLVDGFSPNDEVVLLADIAGGSPATRALDVLDRAGFANRTVAFGGVNLPMALCACMGIEDDLDLYAMRDALTSDGTQAIQQL